MRSVNKVIIIGNLTRDPELRQTPNGQNVTTFGVATNREWNTQSGDRKSSAEFHECVAWAKLAEICSTYLKKGSLVYVEGYLKTRSWDSSEGIKKFKTEIVVQDMIMLEKRKDGDDDSNDDYLPEGDDSYDDDSSSEDSTASEATSTETETAPESTNNESVEEVAPSTEEKKSDDIDPIDMDLGL